MKAVALTTKDNPYDYFDDFTKWYMYDKEMHYDTCEHLDRIALTSDELSMEENYEIIEEAVDRIIKNDFLNIYIKVTKEVPDAMDLYEEPKYQDKPELKN